MIDDFLTKTSPTADLLGWKWYLIRTADQPHSREAAIAPVAPFSTGFLSASAATIGQHIRERYAKAKADNDPMKDFWPAICAVLDERSARDNTILIVQHHNPHPGETPSSVPQELRPENWQTMRVTFERARSALFQVSQVPWAFFDELGRSSYKIEDNVWDIEDMTECLYVDKNSTTQS